MSVEPYFKKELDDVVFINLREGFFEKKPELAFLKGVPIPVSLGQISQEARVGRDKSTISPAAAVEAMAFVLGADPHFPYKEAYLRFLDQSVKAPYLFLLGMGIPKTEQEEYKKAAVLFRASDVYDRWKREQSPVAPMKRDPRKPEYPDALFNYARACRDVYMESEDTAEKLAFREESVRVFEELTELFPDFDQSYFFLGYFYMNKKEYQKAKTVWERFLELTAEGVQREDIQQRMIQLEDMMLYEKGYLAVLNDRSQEGLDILLPLYEKYKEWWNLLFFIGLAYRKLDLPQKGIPFFKEVARLKPSQSDALNELGLCYAALEDYESAEKYLKKAALVEENDPELLCNLAAVYISWGKLELAEKTLLKAEELSPEEQIVQMWRSELEKRKSM